LARAETAIHTNGTVRFPDHHQKDRIAALVGIHFLGVDKRL
jgi:hypothetical protein